MLNAAHKNAAALSPTVEEPSRRRIGFAEHKHVIDDPGISATEDDDHVEEEDDARSEAKSSVSSITCTVFLHKQRNAIAPKSCVEKMEGLARVVPYSADAALQGTHQMPLRLAQHAQVKQMVTMIGLPIFGQKNRVATGASAAVAKTTNLARNKPRRASITSSRTSKGRKSNLVLSLIHI